MTKKEREKARKMAEDAKHLEDTFQQFASLYSILNIDEPILRCMFAAAGGHAIKHLQDGNYSDTKCESWQVFEMNALRGLSKK